MPLATLVALGFDWATLWVERERGHTGGTVGRRGGAMVPGTICFAYTCQCLTGTHQLQYINLLTFPTDMWFTDAAHETDSERSDRYALVKRSGTPHPGVCAADWYTQHEVGLSCAVPVDIGHWCTLVHTQTGRITWVCSALQSNWLVETFDGQISLKTSNL